MSNLADSLFQMLFKMRMDYPESVKPVPTSPSDRIAGTAFFPGGNGCYVARGYSNEMQPQVMVIGNNFGTWDDFRSSVIRGFEDPGGGTWGPMLKILDNNIIDPLNCFYTNVFMGFLGSKNNTDKMKKTQSFTRQCHSFLEHQILCVKPKLIITLGDKASHALGVVSQPTAAWKGSSISSLDLNAISILPFHLASNDIHTSGHAVALLHPSYWGTTRGGTERMTFERNLLKRAVSMARLIAVGHLKSI